MSILLKNDILCIEIDTPGENYQSSRFDWTGQITQITYKNKYTFCTEEILNSDLINIRGRGLYNEFGIDVALGYDDCKVGELFPKIGVGLIQKDTNEPYNFYKDYKVYPFKTSVNYDNLSVTFVSYPKPCNGYAFVLKKHIVLYGNSFTIQYFLENTGEKTIITNEYCHNFLSINRKEINKDYKLIFPFTIDQNKFNELVDPDKKLIISKHSISWKTIGKEQFFIGNVNTSKEVIALWSLENYEEGVGIKETGNFKTNKINVWGNIHVVSPELFISINIEPGKSMTWERKYEIFQL